MSIKTRRSSFAPNAKTPTANTVRAGLLNSIAKAQPATKLATARSEQLQRISELKRRMPRQVNSGDRDDDAEAQSDGQQDHHAVGQAAHGSDGLVLQ